MNDTEQMLGDALADGKITDEDADQVRQFAEFLRAAGPPDGGAGKRLREAGRTDLLEYAMGGTGTVEMIKTTISEQWDICLPEHRAARGDEWKTWERERLESMHEHLAIGDVVYDIGAEEGDFPGLYATWGCQVAMFEPNPRVWPNMRAVWEANELPDPLGCFVGFAGNTDTRAVDQLQGTGWYFEDWPVCAYGPIIGDHGFMNLSERPDVPVITLNTASGIVAPPDAITIDVEGSELEVLRGAAAVVLTEHRPKLWVSIHPQFMADMYDQHPDQLHSLLIGHGYRGRMLADVHEEHWLFLPEEMGKP